MQGRRISCAALHAAHQLCAPRESKKHSHTRRNTRAPELVSQNEGSASAFNPMMNSNASSPVTARLAGDDTDLRQLEARLAMEGDARERLRRELDMRNC